MITETLRMGNIIIGVMRKAMKDVEIKGHLIPKGWCALAYFRSVHLDENHYDWPHEFNPWRWQVGKNYPFFVFYVCVFLKKKSLQKNYINVIHRTKI